ncbi:hypothetical protein BAE44_0013511 [Dichanthelium oligosanthes]|uniref:DUF1499 domain-containing protein n=1 Tax=Dichanthelium oligosanthes TaxID=888268 RepID=A0A1E5VK37_9POAL|nr:hypothetical protein BAE44_0013511 [Dichanthelium oligosanthes]
MAARVVCCCLPVPAGAAASSSSSPPNLKGTNKSREHTRIGRRNYNPKDGRRGKPISKEEAMKELIEVVSMVTKTKPDNFSPHIAEQTDDYVRVEYESPIFGFSFLHGYSTVQFVDDVEFWFPPGNKAIVQYRSASRSGFVDFNANKKRVKELRLALQRKGWASESNL